ncbi:MAG: molybdopterin molybdotransferase [Arenicella sp.]|jgi:molybdopterin molybdotransferase
METTVCTRKIIPSSHEPIAFVNLNMISVEEAIDLVENNIPLGKTERKLLSDSVGFTLSESISSPIDMPPFPQSAMDGYAVNFDETISEYELVGEVAAGSDQQFELSKGEAVRIFTGAAVPLTANTVVRQEDVLVGPSTPLRVQSKVSFTEKVKLNANIRPQAEQIQKGTLAVEAGSFIDAGTLGYLAALGITEVTVFSKPKIALLTTGDELVKPGQDLKHGQVFESNSVMLQAAFESKGISEITHLKIPDDYDQTVASIKSVMNDNDFVIMSGGISVGDYDFVGKALKELEVEQVFYKVKQKPGKPLFFGKKESTTFFALPGNPAAALTSFYVYIFPSLQKFQGGEFAGCKRITLPIAHAYERKAQRSEFLKGSISDGKLSVLNAQSSAMLSSFSKADCLIYIPESHSSYVEGDMVECLIL